MPTLREALESALVENPDDLAAHMAYADHLQEQGDPRGELIQVQLALENESLPRGERNRLKARERRLLGRTRDACLGELAPLLRVPGCEFMIQRGWLTSVEIDVLFRKLALAMSTAPEARLLHRLAFTHVGIDPFRARDEPDGLTVLARSRNLPNLRALSLGTLEGFRDEQSEPIEYNRREALYHAGDDVWDWLATLPGLEELCLQCVTVHTRRLFSLPTLENLWLLQVHLSDDYPLDALADNPALRNLTHLSLHPLARGPFLGVEQLAALAGSPNLPALTHLRFQRSDAGDDGVRALLDGDLLDRLTYLDLAMGTVTDEGADLLADADLGRLEVLDLSRNALSADGVAALEQAGGFVLRVDDQDVPGNPRWLYAGEME